MRVVFLCFYTSPLHLLVVLSKMALVDTIFPYLQNSDIFTLSIATYFIFIQLCFCITELLMEGDSFLNQYMLFMMTELEFVLRSDTECNYTT